MRNQFVTIAAAMRVLCLATRKNALWLFILAYAVTACVWNPSAVADAWWLIFVPVWIFAHRRQNPDQRPGAALLVSSLLLFGWLFNSTQSAAVVAFRSWVIPAGELWLRNLSFPLQATLASLITALTLTVPIRHTIRILSGSRQHFLGSYVGRTSARQLFPSIRHYRTIGHPCCRVQVA